jgi:hypothetical protein
MSRLLSTRPLITTVLMCVGPCYDSAVKVPRRPNRRRRRPAFEAAPVKRSQSRGEMAARFAADDL